MSEQTLPKISGKDAVEMMKCGKHILHSHIEELVLSDEIFPTDVYIENCQIGDVVFKNCTFKRSFTVKFTTFLGKVELNLDPDQIADAGQTAFAQDAIFHNCSFAGEVSGKCVHFHKQSVWRKTRFQKRISLAKAEISRGSFLDCQFEDSCRFERMLVTGTISFEGSIFQGRANFKAANLGSNANFRRTDFQNGVSFENATFGFARLEDMKSQKKSVFKAASFNANAYFHRTLFEGDINFRGCQSKGNLYLSHMVCNGSADFAGMESFNCVTIEQSRFFGPVHMDKCIAHHDVILRGSIFEDMVSFAEAFFHSRLDCTHANFKKQVKLFSANPSVLLLERSQVEGKIVSALENDHAKAKKVYVMLLRTFQFWGNQQDADWAYYQLRQAERKAHSQEGGIAALQSFFNWLFFDIGSGYGTKPLNVTMLAALVIFAFALVFWGFGDQFVVDEAIRGDGTGVSFAQSLYLSAMTFTTLGTEGIAPKFDNWLKYFMVVEGFLGLFLMTVFVGTYTRKMVK